MQDGQQPPGWYPAQGDPPGTVRWWDGTKWVGGPQTQGAQQQAGYVAPGAGTLANGRELADPWLRIAAWVIDFVLLVIVSIPFGIAFAVSAIDGGGLEPDGSLSGGTFALAALGGFITTAYIVLMNAYLSGTAGKLMLGLRIVSREGTQPLGLGLAIRRTLNHIVSWVFGLIPVVAIGVIIPGVFLLIGIVSLVFLFSDAEHRTVMDRFADTYVVKKV